MSDWDNAPTPYPYYETATDDEDDTWFHPVTYDQTVYPDMEPDPALNQHLALDETVPDLLRYSDPGPLPGQDQGQAPLDNYAGYDDFPSGPAAIRAPMQAEAATQAEASGQDWAGGEDEAGWQDEPQPPRFRRVPRHRYALGAQRPRWRAVAVTAVATAALGFGVVVVTGRMNQSLPSSALPSGTAVPSVGRPATAVPGAPGTTGQQPTATAPPITPAQAQQVLATYTATNNTANAQASQARLAIVETGSSLAIDSGIDQGKSASGAAPFPPYGPAHASYYIPLEPSGGYPHRFAVRVQNAFASAPAQVINNEYLIFTQDAAGAPWKNAIEPFILNGVAAPQVAINTNGYATAVAASDPALALLPEAASQATATALDGGIGGVATAENLADQQETAALHRAFPTGATETDRHVAATDAIYGLRTADGGALLFYDVAAQVTVTAPNGGTLPLNVPGFLSPGNPVTQATLDYLEQFATYDPPVDGTGQGAQTAVPSVVGDYSGLTSITGVTR